MLLCRYRGSASVYVHEGGENTTLSTYKWQPAVSQAGKISLEEIEIVFFPHAI